MIPVDWREGSIHTWNVTWMAVLDQSFLSCPRLCKKAGCRNSNTCCSIFARSWQANKFYKLCGHFDGFEFCRASDVVTKYLFWSWNFRIIFWSRASFGREVRREVRSAPLFPLPRCNSTAVRVRSLQNRYFCFGKNLSYMHDFGIQNSKRMLLENL